MEPPIRITSLTFNSGQQINVDADVVVLVGANNTGKSRTLSEIFSTLSRSPGAVLTDLFALSAVGMERRMDADGLVKWLESNRTVYQVSGEQYRRIHHAGVGDIHENQVAWGFQHDRIASLAPFLLRNLTCGERLGYVGSPQRLDYNQHPDHPIQVLATNPDLMTRLAVSVERAFGQHLLADSWGTNIRLRMHPTLTQAALSYESSDGTLPPEKRLEFDSIPLVEQQSDGVRAFVGIMLTVLASEYPVYLLDEPEAFLHPPQAREIGRQLASLPDSQQVFIATHSLDVLLGVLEASGSRRVQIVRLFREDAQTSCAILDPGQLDQIRSDPLLRFGKALDGMFHDRAIVCEGDSDAAFYSLFARDIRGAHPMFTYAGAKHRVHKIARALTAVEVPVSVIVDFDALNDKGLMTRIVESVGGTWSAEMTRHWKILDMALRAGRKPPTHQDARAALDSIGKDPGQEWTKMDRDAFDKELLPSNGWSGAKNQGLHAVPAGDASASAEALLSQLAELGVHVVPVGQMESFIKSEGGHGPEWVVHVVENDKWSSCAGARQLVYAALGLPHPGDYVPSESGSGATPEGPATPGVA